MKKIYKNEALEWSNLFFLIPLAISMAHGLYWYTIILGAVFVVSFDFHFLKESKKIHYIDVIFSITLMTANLVLLFVGNFALPFSALAIVFASTALFLFFRKSKHNYYINHSLWHIFSAGVYLFCLLTFLSV